MILREVLPGEGDLYRPAFIGDGGVIDGSSDMHRAFEAGEITAEDRHAALAIGLGEAEFPDRAEGIDLEFVVVEAIAVRVDEDFEVVIFKHDGILLSDGAPDVWLLKFCADVEVVIIPAHLDPRLVVGLEGGVAGDIGKVIRPREFGPGGVGERAIDFDRALDSLAVVAAWGHFFLKGELDDGAGG